MTALSLEPTYTELQRLMAFHAGWDRTPASWTTIQATDGADILEEAFTQVYFPPPLPEDCVPHEWSFLTLEGELDLNVSYSTGTVGVASNGSGSIVTLATGTWPAWAAAGDLWVGGERYTVKSRTSNSVIVLNNVSVTVAAGTSYSLIQHYYDLPDDFGSLPSDHITWRRDQTAGGGRIQIVGEAVIRRHDSAHGLDGYPGFAALIPVAPISTQSTRWQLLLWPLPSSACTLVYRYKAIPPALDGTTNVYHYGGVAHADTFKASVVDVTYRKIRESDEKRPAFLEQLRRSVQYDRRHNATNSYGPGARSLSPRRPTIDSTLRDVRSSIPASNIHLSFG